MARQSTHEDTLAARMEIRCSEASKRRWLAAALADPDLCEMSSGQRLSAWVRRTLDLRAVSCEEWSPATEGGE